MTTPSERLRAEAEAYARECFQSENYAPQRAFIVDGYMRGAHSRDSEIAALVAALERAESTCALSGYPCGAHRAIREALAAHRERGEK